MRTYPIPDAGQLLDRLVADVPCAWVRDGEGLIGWGEAARVELSGPSRFAEAERWWDEIRAGFIVDDTVGLNGSGPVAFASFGFDPLPGHSVLIVPRVIIGRRNRRSWVTVVGDWDGQLAPVRGDTGPNPVSYADGALSPLRWMGAVGDAVRRIGRGDVDKVVLARDLIASAGAPIDQRQLLRRLAQRYPSCWSFAVDGLVGATPELLVRRAGDQVASRVLAGTVSRVGGAHDDQRAVALLGSEKDLEEHRFAVQSVATVLAQHCTGLQVPDEPRVLRLANVQHLATDLTGTVRDGSTALTLAAALHPTAAVCGTPTAAALALIRELEGMDRGRYAGPVGWLGADGDGEFGIALRCAQIDGRQARLFAGCGIVGGSDPEAELAEAQAKFAAVRDALEG